MIKREDVARLAGVSVSTVSRTLNERGYVSAKTREAVWAAVEKLDYRESELTGKKKSSCHLCLILGQSIHNGYCVELYEYMAEYAQSKGYILLLSGNPNMQQIQSLPIDGIIVEDERMAVKIQAAFGGRRRVPVVSVSSGLSIVQTKRIPYIDVNGYQVMEMAISYLRKKGHRKIAYAAPDVRAKGDEIQLRSVAYRNMMLPELGERKYNEYLIASEKTGESLLEKRNCFEEGGYGAEEFAKKKCDATAVVCFNDEYALGMIYRLEKMGYKIPHDVSVIGIDGLKKREIFVPKLTSVSLNTELLARSSVQAVIDMIEGRKVGRFISVKPQILEGESVRTLV